MVHQSSYEQPQALTKPQLLVAGDIAKCISPYASQQDRVEAMGNLLAVVFSLLSESSALTEGEFRVAVESADFKIEAL